MAHLYDYARSDEDRQVFDLIFGALVLGRMYITPPDIPPTRLTALRRAFDATVKDPEFLAEAARTKLTVGPLPGEELQKLVGEVAGLSPEMTQKVKAAYATPK